jgi:hypothetical protein
MSQGGGLRGLAFGTPDGELWGAVLDAAPGAGEGAAALVLGAGETDIGRSRGLHWVAADGAGWQLEGEGVTLTVAPLEDRLADAALCRVHGTVSLDSELVLDCPGVRVALAPPRSARQAPASARLVGGFFPDGTAVVLLAARPGRSAHQDSETVTAALFDAEESIAVRDPRLSTTYDETGAPTRTNLELWVGEGEDEFPRRAAGEAAGPGGSVTVAGGALQVVPLRCHSRGEDGAGVYALARF